MLVRQVTRLFWMSLMIGQLLWVSVYASELRSYEYKIKAVYLFNFAKFITWPADAFANEIAPIAICIIGDDPFGDSIETTVYEEKINGRDIIVKRLPVDQDFGACHIALIGKSTQTRIGNISDRSIYQNTLIVGETKELFQNGGMVSFGVLNDKICFEFNFPIIAQSNLKISSKLLALSRPIQP